MKRFFRATQVIVLAWLILAPFLSAPVPAAAAGCPGEKPTLKCTLKEKGTNFFTVIYGEAPSADVTPTTIAGDIIQALLGFLGIVFIVLIIWAGWNWMTARGDDDKVGKANLQIVHAVIGLLVILAAYLATYLVFDVLLQATSQPLDDLK